MKEKFVTEKFQTHTESGPSNSVDAGAVVLTNIGRSRRKRRASTSAKIISAVSRIEESQGNDRVIVSDSSTKKIHSKNGIVEEVESVNYMLPEERNKTLASFSSCVILRDKT